MSALIWCPFPDRDSARRIANSLLDEELVACANLLGAIESVFQWQGNRESAHEIGVLFKTDAALLDRAVARLAVLHPYDTPAIMGWRCDAVPDATRAWLGLLGQGDR
ncbi:divalent-cation tolerance protein CutA [Altererythrobacter sp. BO-6]|uniref:divalent-cation tolerance protein CutA n=1 Tax=Altererythrobacter sp. BO-6 TaxID=2604537 RepID=UPI0013E1F67B|nr:divalent-cation tolerance protein CutA [Altererythrobacter sp. BO-6]QIG54186.1 divalent-cation tolerance protein CutA [Altererythrobacter sp. BO-6]